jgi:hypothetical protein
VRATRRLEGQPAEHPIGQMTTYELRELREQLEETLAMQTLPRYVRPREDLSRQFTEVIAEQDQRARIRREPHADA